MQHKYFGSSRNTNWLGCSYAFVWTFGNFGGSQYCGVDIQHDTARPDFVRRQVATSLQSHRFYFIFHRTMAIRLLAANLLAAALLVEGVVFPLEDGDDHGSALSLLQGRASKIIKSRPNPIQSGSSRSAARAAAVALEDLDDFGSLSLMQEKQSKIKKGGSSSSSCSSSASELPAPKSGREAALFAAVQDGVEDGMFALNLMQKGRAAALRADECHQAGSTGASHGNLAAADAAADDTLSLLQEKAKLQPRRHNTVSK